MTKRKSTTRISRPRKAVVVPFAKRFRTVVISSFIISCIIFWLFGNYLFNFWYSCKCHSSDNNNERLLVQKAMDLSQKMKNHDNYKKEFLNLFTPDGKWYGNNIKEGFSNTYNSFCFGDSSKEKETIRDGEEITFSFVGIHKQDRNMKIKRENCTAVIVNNKIKEIRHHNDSYEGLEKEYWGTCLGFIVLIILVLFVLIELISQGKLSEFILEIIKSSKLFI